MKRLMVVSLVLVMMSLYVNALIHPHTVYCTRLGYEYTVQQTPKGALGSCIMPDGNLCSTRDFAYGKCGTQYNYCSKKGYRTLTIEGDYEKCRSLGGTGSTCGVCLKEDGYTIEMVSTAIKDSELGEEPILQDLAICGDNVCALNEKQTCPKDCVKKETIPSNEKSDSICGNAICEAKEDEENCPKDCSTSIDSTTRILAGVFIVVVAILIAVSRKKQVKAEEYVKSREDSELEQIENIEKKIE